MSVVRIRVQLEQDGQVVHEFTRSTTNATGQGVARLVGQALGWLQAYQGAVNDRQWAADVQRVNVASPPPPP